jgi:7-keto-8-aminopelargonate synthetase-like enzyme
MKKTEIKLTEDQAEKVTRFWEKHGDFGKSMLAQPTTYVGGRFTIIKIGMLDPELAQKISRLLLEHARSSTK